MTARAQFTFAYVWLYLAFAAAPSARAGAYEETTPFVGIRHIHRTTTLPRLLDVNVVEIDPTAPGVDFLVTPSNGGAPGETVAQTTRAFAMQHQTQVAVNASFFAYVSGANMNIEGLAASRGDVYSSFQAARTVALNISATKLATIIESTLGTGTEHSPAASQYNAVGGNERILAGGAITAGDTALHPRTAAGVTAEGKIILMTVDGRNAGHSLSVTTPELASLMLQYGVRDAINLDGGGSTTLVFSDPTPRVVNVPVGVGNVTGSERSNGNNLGVYAASYSQPTNNRFVSSDFESGDAGHFGRSLLASGSTAGVLSTSSTAVAGGGRPESPGSQRLVIRDDPTASGSSENPDGWFVRHLSGAPNASTPASRSANEIRPTVDIVGLWARTASPGVEVSLAIDDSNNVSADRGVRQPLIADGQWRRYEWNLQYAVDWEGWLAATASSTGLTSPSTRSTSSVRTPMPWSSLTTSFTKPCPALAQSPAISTSTISSVTSISPYGGKALARRPRLPPTPTETAILTAPIPGMAAECHFHIGRKRRSSA